MDLAIVTGFGDKGLDELEGSLNEALPINSSRIIASTPWYRALSHPETIIDRVSDEFDQIDTDELLLVGHSYGTLIALMAALRRKLDGISGIFLIDGPLRSDCEVVPAKLLHNLFFRHYAYRKHLAQTCSDVLEHIDLSRIRTIGSQFDRIVPPEAKRLDGVQHFQLPPEHKGHGIHKRIDIITEFISKELTKMAEFDHAA